MNHGAIFGPRDIFSEESGSESDTAAPVTSPKTKASKMNKKNNRAGSLKHPIKHTFALVPGPPLKREDLLSQKGLEKVVKSIGEGGVEAGNPVGPIEDPPEGCSPPKKPKTPVILQKGPSRHAQQQTPHGGSGEPGPSKTITCAMKNLQLQRTQSYIEVESPGIDSSTPVLTSDQSGSSTPTYLDTESDFDEVDVQTRVECNEMGIDPQALHSDIKELVYMPEDGKKVITAEDCLRAVNVILADAESLPGLVVTAFKIENGSVIGTLKKTFTSGYTDNLYLGTKTLEITSINPVIAGPAPDLHAAVQPDVRPPSLPSNSAEAPKAQDIPPTRVITLIAPKRSGGAPFRFNIAPEMYDECAANNQATAELARAILKKMGVFGTYRFTCDYSRLDIEIETE